MKKLAIWAPIGGALCLLVAAALICRASRKDVQDIYGMLERYK